MGIRTLVASLAGLVLASSTLLPSAATPAQAPRTAPGPAALWDADFGPGLKAEDCGRWKLDDGFCTANDWRNGVELGTRFRTSRVVSVVGVRAYRVDPATVTGSLWDGQGNRIATGTFAPTTRKGWQDLVFAQPVAISPGQSYIASYYTPATKYAFQYDFFDRQVTRGPITALRATDSAPNGVHCYDVAPCTSPTDGFRSSSYWVTPLWQDVSDPTAPDPTPTPAPTPPAAVAPVVNASVPGAGATRVSRSASIKVTFSTKIRAATLTRASVRLQRKGKAVRVPMRMSYDAQRARLTLTPKSRLRPGTTYRVVVTSKVRDTLGNALDQDPDKPGIQRASWTFRTR
ncbi:exported hypothetical protein [metagenome]|uniref:SbsA Ig-like domain-containing protein n=1 Tax=metagenome TaxID=256318 RepID=A0A2P2CKM4_9ZZZZ